MKPSVAEAIKARAQEDLATKYAELKEQLDRIEAKLDAVLAGQNVKPAGPAKADSTKK